MIWKFAHADSRIVITTYGMAITWSYINTQAQNKKNYRMMYPRFLKRLLTSEKFFQRESELNWQESLLLRNFRGIPNQQCKWQTANYKLTHVISIALRA